MPVKLLLLRWQLIWLGHHIRMSSNCIPRKVLGGQLIGQRSEGGQNKHSKITSRPAWRSATFLWFPFQLEALAADRETSKSTCEACLTTFLAASNQAAEDQHTRRRHASSNLPLSSWPVKPITNKTVNILVIWQHSFIHSSGAAVGRWQSFNVPFSLPPALRPRHGPVRNSPLTLGLVLYVYRA